MEFRILSVRHVVETLLTEDGLVIPYWRAGRIAGQTYVTNSKGGEEDVERTLVRWRTRIY